MAENWSRANVIANVLLSIDMLPDLTLFSTLIFESHTLQNKTFVTGENLGSKFAHVTFLIVRLIIFVRFIALIIII